MSKHHDVILISLSGTGSKVEAVYHNERFREVRVPRSRISVYMHAIIDTFTDIKECSAITGSIDSRYFNHGIKAEAMKALKDCDTVIFNSPYMFVLPDRAYAQKRVIYESQNAEHELMRDTLGNSIIGRLLARYARESEKAMLSRSDVVTAVSNDDMASLAALSGRSALEIRLLENGVDLDSYQDVARRRKERKSRGRLCVFIGSYHPPNIDAIKNISMISGADPTLTYVAAGSAAKYYMKDGCQGASFKLNGHDNISLIPVLSDAEKRDILVDGDIAINPMTGGSGTNVKVLEYMAAGIPVITTSHGARGLRIEPGKHAIVCRLDEFPANINRVLDDDMLYRRLADEGRKLVAEHYDWTRIAGDLEKILEEADK